MLVSILVEGVRYTVGSYLFVNIVNCWEHSFIKLALWVQGTGASVVILLR
jgi:hypothetical protein